MTESNTLPISIVKELLAQQREDFVSLITSMSNAFHTRFDKLHETVIELKCSIEYSQKDIDNLKKQTISQQELLVKKGNDLVILGDNVDKHASKLDYIENQTRRNNVRFDGIPESTPKAETWQESEEKVRNILKTKLGMTNTVHIERAHRVGPVSQGRINPRTIIVKLTHYKDREEVFRNARKLKGTRIYVNEDLSDRVLEKRREQIDLLHEARQQGKIAYFSYDRLIIKDRPTFVQQQESARPMTRSQSTSKPSTSPPAIDQG